MPRKCPSHADIGLCPRPTVGEDGKALGKAKCIHDRLDLLLFKLLTVDHFHGAGHLTDRLAGLGCADDHFLGLELLIATACRGLVRYLFGCRLSRFLFWSRPGQLLASYGAEPQDCHGDGGINSLSDRLALHNLPPSCSKGGVDLADSRVS
jgi:hypothetical protein